MNKEKNQNCFPVKTGKYEPVIKNEHSHVDELKLKHRFELKQGCYGVRSVNIADDRYLIITNQDNPKIRVVDLERLEFLPHKYEGHTHSVRLTSISADNKCFYTASWDSSYRFFEISSGKCTQILSGLGRSPSCFLDPEHKYLFTASYDSDYDLESKNTGRCWELSTGKVFKEYKHTQERKHPECIDIAYDQQFVYTGSDDGIAFKWNLKEEKPLFSFFQFEGAVRKVTVSVNYFAAACTDGIIRVHNKYTGECFRNLKHAATDVREVRISKDETKLWSAAADGSVACYNLNSGELIYHRKLHSSWIWSICLMMDEKILVTGSGDGTVVFLAAGSGHILMRFFNLAGENDFLSACPSDKSFPNGFFYTNKMDFIQVSVEESDNGLYKILDFNDSRRKAYINKLNIKNLVISRFKNKRQYDSLMEHYMQHQIKLNRLKISNTPRLLKV
jgi:WD40 repeat protein